MLHDPRTEAARIGQGDSHQSGRADGAVPICEGDRARLGQQPKLGKLFAAASGGDRAVWDNGQTARLLAPRPQQTHQGRVVNGGQGVGQGGQRGDTAGGCRLCSGGNGFAVFVARLTEGRAHIDQAWTEDRPILGNHRRTVRPAQARSEIGDQATAHEQIAVLVDT